MAEIFRVSCEPRAVQKYTLVHVPSGITAGGFWYRRHAKAAAAAMTALADRYDLTSAAVLQNSEALAALKAAREPHKVADHEQMCAVEKAKRERKGR